MMMTSGRESTFISHKVVKVGLSEIIMNKSGSPYREHTNLLSHMTRPAVSR